MSVDEATALMRRLLEQVGKMHRQGRVHLAINPDNIIVERMPDNVLVPGLMEVDRHQWAIVDGFTPIEQYAGKDGLTPASDVYSLGATMIFCLTGRSVAAASDVNSETVRAMLPQGGDLALCDLLSRSLSMRIANRPSTADDFLRELDQISSPGHIDPAVEATPLYVPRPKTTLQKPLPPAGGAVPAPMPEVPTEKKGNGLLGWAMVAFIAICAAAALWVFVFDKSDDNDRSDRRGSRARSENLFGYAGSDREDVYTDSIAAVAEAVEVAEPLDYYEEEKTIETITTDYRPEYYDMRFHELVPGTGVRSMTINGQTFTFDRQGNWTNQYYTDALYDRSWQLDNLGRRTVELYSDTNGSGQMYYQWDDENPSVVRDEHRGFTVYRSFNPNGTISSVTTAYDEEGKPSRSIDYTDYRYDSSGNWTSRRVGKQTQRREIYYW